MKIKVGNNWYSGEEEIIMIKLTDDDIKNIRNLRNGYTKYCQFPNYYTLDEVKEFMTEE